MTETDHLHDQAEAALAANRLDDAHTIYTRICELDITDVGARMMLGAIERQKGNLETAADHLASATSQDPDFTEAFMMLGAVYGQLGRLPEAETTNRRVLALDPTLTEARFNLGNALKGQGKAEEAAECYRAVLRDKPDLVAAWSLLASSLLEAGDPAAASEAARQAITVSPDNWQSHLVLGRALHQQDEFTEAAANFLRATELAPDQADAWFLAGGALGQIGEFKQAEACCRRAIELMPEHAEAHLNLGNALREQHRIKEATKAFEVALEKLPESIEALCSLGGAHALLCQYHQAANCFRQAIEIQPDNANLYRSLGSILRLGGELTQSETACRRAVKLDPECSESYLELGETLSAQGRDEEALDAYDKALERAPDTIAAIAGKARCYERSREYTKAHDCLRPLIEKGIKDYNLASAYVLLSKRVNKQRDALRMTEELLDQGGLSDYERAGLHFCAGKLYDQLEQHERAFKHIQEGCKYKHAEFDREEYTAYINTLIYAFNPGTMERLPHGRNPSERPVFIVGMPRSGTSLVEQIIASHPAVYGAGELQEINRIATMLSAHSPDKAPFPRCLMTLTQSQIDAASQSYLEKAQGIGWSRYIYSNYRQNATEFRLPGTDRITISRRAGDPYHAKSSGYLPVLLLPELHWPPPLQL